MGCRVTGCSNELTDRDGSLCSYHFRQNIKGLSFQFHGPALTGNKGFHRTRNEHMLQHFGTTDDRELGKRGIERAPS